MGISSALKIEKADYARGIRKAASFMDRVNGFRDEVFNGKAKEEQGELWQTSTLRDVKRLILVNSAPRSGSSLLYAVLKDIPGLASISGECVPFYKLNGISTDLSPSDMIPDDVAGGVDFKRLSRDFLSDASIGDATGTVLKDAGAARRYASDLLLRFSIEWPQISFDAGVFSAIASKALLAHSRQCKRFSAPEFYVELIKGLSNEYPQINPYYYDMALSLVKKSFPDMDLPEGPPNDVLMIEEPPFILANPRKKIDSNALKDKALILKSPLNCYRMNFIRKAFPNAEIKIISLARNPLASVNGLYDGWLYRGFFSHNLKAILNNGTRQLDIKGYSEKAPWARWWWKFDLPPGWEGYTEKNLEEVCLFQWISANKAGSDYLSKEKGVESCQVRYEDLVGGIEKRQAEFRKIIGFLGFDGSVLRSLRINPLPVIQATAAPRQSRWKDRWNMLMPLVLGSKTALEISEGLGYRKKDIDGWQ